MASSEHKSVDDIRSEGEEAPEGYFKGPWSGQYLREGYVPEGVRPEDYYVPAPGLFGFSQRTPFMYDIDLWNLLAPVTLNATYAIHDIDEDEELRQLEEEFEEELRAIREAPAPTPIGVKPNASDEEDEATATEDRDVDDSRDGDEEEEDEEEYDDDLDDASDS